MRRNPSTRRRSTAGAFHELPEASHFHMAEPGWEAVADRALAFLGEHLTA